MFHLLRSKRKSCYNEDRNRLSFLLEWGNDVQESRHFSDNSIMHQNGTSSQYPPEEAASAAEPLPAGAEAQQGNDDARQTNPSVSRQPEVTTFSSPGLTPARRYGTAIMLLLLGLFVVGVIWYDGLSVIVCAIIGFILIAGFIWYLRTIAPAPFTLTLAADGLTRQEQGGEPQVIPWDQIARVKEEQFPNGKVIGIMVYARSKTSVYRALVLWRGDLPGFDAFRAALKASTLPETPWHLETVHE